MTSWFHQIHSARVCLLVVVVVVQHMKHFKSTRTRDRYTEGERTHEHFLRCFVLQEVFKGELFYCFLTNSTNKIGEPIA